MSAQRQQRLRLGFFRTSSAFLALCCGAAEQAAPQEPAADTAFIFQDDFEHGFDRWRFPLGDGVRLTTLSDGGTALALETRAQPVYALIEGSESWGNVRMEGRVLFPDSGHSYLGFIYRYHDNGRRIDFGSLYIKGNDSYVQANPHFDTNAGRTLYPELRALLADAATVRIGEWIDFALEVVGSEAHLYVGAQDAPQFTFPFDRTTEGAFGFKPRNPGDPVWIDDIRVRQISRFSYDGPPIPAPVYQSSSHVLKWDVIGPFAATHTDVEGEFDPDAIITEEGRELQWFPFEADARGAVLTGAVTEYRGDRRVAYFHATLEATTSCRTVLDFSGVDDLALWLNGRFLGFAPRGTSAWWDAGDNPDHPPTARATVHVREGLNHLIVRAIGGVYVGGGFYLRAPRC